MIFPHTSFLVRRVFVLNSLQRPEVKLESSSSALNMPTCDCTITSMELARSSNVSMELKVLEMSKYCLSAASRTLSRTNLTDSNESIILSPLVSLFRPSTLLLSKTSSLVSQSACIWKDSNPPKNPDPFSSTNAPKVCLEPLKKVRIWVI